MKISYFIWKSRKYQAVVREIRGRCFEWFNFLLAVLIALQDITGVPSFPRLLFFMLSSFWHFGGCFCVSGEVRPNAHFSIWTSSLKQVIRFQLQNHQLKPVEKQNFSLSIYELNINCTHHPLRTPAALLGYFFLFLARESVGRWKSLDHFVPSFRRLFGCTWKQMNVFAALAVASYPKKINTNMSVVKSFSCLALVEEKSFDGKMKQVNSLFNQAIGLAIRLGYQ